MGNIAREGQSGRARLRGALAIKRPTTSGDVAGVAKQAADQTIPKDAFDAFPEMCGSADKAFNLTIFRETLPTVWFHNDEMDGQDQRYRAVMTALRAFKPRDEIEGLLAAQAVALHFGAMECLRRAMIPDQPSNISSRLRRDGANLARAMTEMLDALERKRGKGPQVVRVERVVVQEGGRAIVGNVTSGATNGPQQAAIGATAPGPALDLSASPAHALATAKDQGEGQ